MMFFVAFRKLFTFRAKKLNFLDLNVSGPTFFLYFPIFLLYGYVEGHMTVDDFSWTDPLDVPAVHSRGSSS